MKKQSNADKYAAQYKYRKKNKANPEMAAKTKAYQREYQKKNANNPIYRHIRLKARAKMSGRKFSIPKDVYIKRIQDGCSYCGADLMSSNAGNMDRIDNDNYDYTEENTRACCATCNNIKCYALTANEMEHVMKSLGRYRKKHGWKKPKSRNQVIKAKQRKEIK